jgi:hypothetical protein
MGESKYWKLWWWPQYCLHDFDNLVKWILWRQCLLQRLFIRQSNQSGFVQSCHVRENRNAINCFRSLKTLIYKSNQIDEIQKIPFENWVRQVKALKIVVIVFESRRNPRIKLDQAVMQSFTSSVIFTEAFEYLRTFLDVRYYKKWVYAFAGIN